MTKESQSFLKGGGIKEDSRITKNVIVLGLAFMLHFTAFLSMIRLQSSLNAEGSMGTYSLSIMTIIAIVSNMFVSVPVLKWLGCKWAIAASIVTYMPYIAAQFHPRFYTLFPTGLLIGIGSGPLWCAKSTYLTVVAEAYAKLLNGRKKKEEIVMRFFGTFYMFFQAAPIWGNLISSAVLSSSIGSGDAGPAANVTAATGLLDVVIRNVSEVCGANFCPGVSRLGNPNLMVPHPLKVELLAAIFLSMMILAFVLVAVFLDSQTRYDQERKGAGSGLSGMPLLVVTLKQLRQPTQMLMMPISLFLGAQIAFVTSELTTSFVACGLGISRIGYVMFGFGVANSVAGALSGSLSKFVGLMPSMWGTASVYLALFVWMRTWVAVENDYLTYFAMTFAWGLTDGILLVQVNAYYGILCPGEEEAAFSNFRLLKAAGSFISFTISPVICTGPKLELLAALAVVGMIGFAITDRMRCKRNRVINIELAEVDTTKNEK